MNYIAEIKAFYDSLELNSLNETDIALWHALMAIANKTAWKREFTVAVSVLAQKSGSNAQKIKRARNRLEQAGYIRWRSRSGSQSAVYQMISLTGKCDFVPQNEPQNEPESVPINKQKHKPKQKKSNADALPENPACDDIVGLYNAVCISFPRVTVLSDARKRAIRARVKQYKFDDFRKVFEAAERSSFLKGDNDRGWKANFDWMIKESNMTKIIDGNYEDTSSRKMDKKAGFLGCSQREYDFEELEAQLLQSDC